MRLDREGKRTLAQFLNSLAVAFVSALVLVPIAGGSTEPDRVVTAVIAAALLHAAALVISAR
jgi:hypothetical protein